MKSADDQPQQCPSWCTEDHTGDHARTVGTSERGDNVRVTGVADNTPLIDVLRRNGPSLTGLTAAQAEAVAAILLDGGHSDGPLVSLLYRAHDLIVPPKPQPHPLGVLLLRLLGRKAAL